MGQDVGLSVDPRMEEPIYRQIFDQIVTRIHARTFPPGYKLPPSRVLATLLSTHRNTVARAYTDLEAAGFVSSTVGRGTFVEGQKPPKSRQGRTRPGDKPAAAFPWPSLLAHGARGSALGRAERFARRTEGDVINLARMQPSLDLLPDVLMRRCIDRVMSEHGARAMAYSPPEGVPQLREQIAAELCSRGVPTTRDDILVTSGSQQAIDLVARVLINPGDAVLVDTTTYSGAIDIFTLAGARLVPVPRDDHGPELLALQRAVRPDVKVLYLMPNGHNPTGRTISTQRRRELVKWSHESGIALIEDDYGAGLSLDAGDHEQDPPYLRALDGDVLYLSTFSKRLIPALRVGFLVCPPALRSTLCSMKRVMDLGTSTVLQLALAEFMERGYLRAHMNRILPEYRARRDALDTALRKALPSEVRWHKPSHGLLLWLPLPPSLDPSRIYEEALRHGVLVSPSPVWSVEEAHAERGLRLSFCAESPKRLAEAAKRLGKVLKTMMAQASRETSSPEGANAPVMELV